MICLLLFSKVADHLYALGEKLWASLVLSYPHVVSDVKSVVIRNRKFYLVFVDATLAAFLCERYASCLTEELFCVTFERGKYRLSIPQFILDLRDECSRLRSDRSESNLHHICNM